MVRFFGFLIGLGFAGVLLISLFSTVSTYVSSPPEATAEEEFHRHPKEVHFASDGPFGRFDKAQLQRGFQVYKEVCAACHSLNRVAFYHLEGLGYNEAQIKNIASAWQTEVPSVNPETGEPATRKALSSDHFPSPYANETAARAANNNALPPDLSLMTKARHEGGAYVYSLLTGYADPKSYRNKEGKALPAANQPGQNLHFNPYFANLNIAMPPPLTSDGQVTYAPGNPAPSRDQMAQDVSAFLAWAAEPNLESRRAAGMWVVIFLIFVTVLAYMAYQNVWATAKRAVRVTGPLDPANIARREAADREAGVNT